MHYSTDLRRKVLKFVAGGGSQSEAARHFNINRSTIYRWQQRKIIAPCLSSSRQSKLIKAEVLKLVEQQNDARLIDYAEQLGVTTQAVWYAFKRWSIVKKTDPLHGAIVYKKDELS